MTLLVRKRSLFGFVLVTAVVVLALVAYEYHIMTRVILGSIGGKLARERVLLLSIVTSGAVLAFGAGVVAKAVMFSAILEKLVTMNRMTGFSPELALERLGEIGHNINLLYRQSSETSAQKSRKIGGLSSLVVYLIGLSESLIIVADSAGTVAYVSQGVVERSDRPRAEIIGRSLEKLLPGGEIGATLQSVRRTRSVLVAKGPAYSVTINPIFSADGEVHYFTVEIPREAIAEIRDLISEGSRAAPSVTGRRTRRSMLPRLFGRRGN